MKQRYNILWAVCVSVWMVVSASADIILRVSFAEPGYNETGNTSGTTASNIPWTSDFAETASSSMIFTGSASGFINAGNADAVALGIAGNVETVGPWSTSFTFTPLQSYVFSDLSFFAYAISGTGNHQLAAHAYQFTVNINTSINLGTVEVVEPAGTEGSLFVLDLAAGTTLFAGTPYTFNITASVGPNDPAVTGNNIGLGSITLNGSVVPEPGSFALVAGGMCVVLRVLRRARPGR